MRSTFRKYLACGAMLSGAAGAMLVALLQAGCSSSKAELITNPGGDTGAVGMQLTLPSGSDLDLVTFTITGPNGAPTTVQTGTVHVTDIDVRFLVGGVPPGSGYTIFLSGTTTDGKTTCAGAADFSTAARTTTNVSVQLQCAAASADAGLALVNAKPYDCATWSAISATPSETTVGDSVAVTAAAAGPNAGALTFAWSAPSGSFDTPNAPTARFTCTTPGPVSVTVTVSDGPVPNGGTCNPSLATAAVQVQCDGHRDQATELATTTRIKHLVVIFGENVAFDHYFGTYPVAENRPGETPFLAAPGTPTPNNLRTPLDPTAGFAHIGGIDLLGNNPNFTHAANGADAANPFRLSSAQAWTQSQGHNYKPEQQADDNGAMDSFPLFVGTAGPPPLADSGAPPAAATKGQVMAYFDGNTVSALWNYAQNYAMNDNSWTTTFGPSSPGAINLISGQTNGFAATNKDPASMSTSHVVADGNGGYTLIGDNQPLGDACSSASSDQNSFSGRNIGDLLNASGVSWGWFQGGFDLTITNANGTNGCNRTTPQTLPGATGISTDYIPHHQPFQFYASTANSTHARPSSSSAIGKSVKADGVTPDPANHQYDSHDFFDALAVGNLPAVVYLKAPAFQDGHPGYSNPLDEQNFVRSVVSAMQASQEWSTTAIVLAYDDTDGWYDHQAPPIVNRSTSAADALNGAGLCNSGAQQTGAAPTMPLLGAPRSDGGAPMPAQGRCGYGTRVPLLIISPYAKRNFIDHTLTDQTSILRFVEDNWLGGQRIQPGGSFDTIANSIANMLNP